MKISYNSKIAKVFTFLKNYKTIMLFGAVFTEKSKSDMSEKEVFHEAAHSEQYNGCLSLGLVIAVVCMFLGFLFNSYGLWDIFLFATAFFLFYIWYLTEYFVRFVYQVLKLKFNFKDAHKAAYHSIAFEAEAEDLQYEYIKPCSKRRTASSFSFLRYYK